MTKIYWYIFIIISLFITSSVKSKELEELLRNSSLTSLPFSNERIQLESERLNRSKINKLMEVLKIRSREIILNIGAGAGQYTYKFAEELKGTGKVFATDIDINMINYMREEVKRRGLNNVYPVLVNSEGVDEFYSKHKYDLIFLSHVYYHLRDRIDYFKKMKEFLAEDGRVAIITYRDRNFSFFSLDDFTDFKGLIKELSLESVYSPFYKGLRNSTRALIKQESEVKLNQPLKNAILSDFNGMLIDTHFCKDFLKEGLIFNKDVSFSIEERDFANWLIRFLKEGQVFEKTKENLYFNQIISILMLNKLLIVQRFRQYLYKGKSPPYLPGVRGYEQGGWISLIKKELKESGYRLEKEYGFVPFEVILVFYK